MRRWNSQNAECGMWNNCRVSESTGNERGVALIIVLLVTALLIALIFEFAYGTRISLRAAANYRDSQRAYYLARSGVFLFGKYKDLLEIEGILPPQGVEGDNPLLPELKYVWEDESGKLDIHQVIQGTPAFNRLSKLFTIRGVDQSTLDNMNDWMSSQQRSFYLLTELHMFLSDEEFQTVRDALTVIAAPRVNVNTAPIDVLRSIGPLDEFTAKKLVERRPFGDTQEITNWLTSETALSPGDRVAVVSALTTSSNVFKVYTRATVGGYTKQIEAIITRVTGTPAAGVTVNYWREL